MSGFLTTELARKAVRITSPAIVETLGSTAKRVAGHLRVSVRTADGWKLLLTRDYGARERWEHPYEEHATSKEQISQRTGLNTREVQAMHPELLEHDDTVYFGSVTDGVICVTFSGVEAYFDELFTWWVMYACKALMEHEQAKQRAAGAEYFA